MAGETIHGFGEHGELSRGAEAALEPLLQRVGNVEQGIADAHTLIAGVGGFAPVSGTVNLPNAPEGVLLGYRVIGSATFHAADLSQITLTAGAYILENAPGGWRVTPVADGSPFNPPPASYNDTFETAAADLFATVTNVGSAPWIPAINTLNGWATSLMRAASGTAHHVPTQDGGGAAIAVDTLDWRVEVAYAVTGSNPGDQVRVAARGNPAWTEATREDMMVQAIVRADGGVLFEPYWTGSAWGQKSLGSTAVKDGVLRLDVVDDTAEVFINDAQIGGTETLPAAQQAGAYVGFGTRWSGKVSEFTATRLV